jgi:hypothetical protein
MKFQQTTMQTFLADNRLGSVFAYSVIALAPTITSKEERRVLDPQEINSHDYHCLFLR